MRLLPACLFAVVAATLFGAGCTTDEKGESCGALDAYTTDEGETYCPDEGAKADCEDFKEVLVDALVGCGTFSEENAEDAADDTFDCDAAVATTTSFEDCVSTLEDTECLGSADDLPDDCKGALLIDT